MNVKQFTGLVPASFEAIGIEPDGTEVTGKINIKLNRLAYDVVTQEGFLDAMEKADKDPRVIGELLAGKTAEDGTVVQKPILAYWEMFENDENTAMLPITCENIITLPFDFVTNLAGAVMDKLFPGPVKAGNLLAGSARTASTNSEAIPDSEATPPTSESDTTSQQPADSTESHPGTSNVAPMRLTGS